MATFGCTPLSGAVDLVPHGNCATYRFWSAYLQSDEPCAVLDLAAFTGAEDYFSKALNATARNRYRYSVNAGYVSKRITWHQRNAHLPDIFEINTSAPMRQGKPMSETYQRQPVPVAENSNSCCEHSADFYACFKNEKMVAYISMNYSGNLCAASQILGHAQHLKNEVMLNLWVAFVNDCMARGFTHIVYSRWKDGTDGLKYWKHSVGMVPVILKEKPGAVV